MALQKAYNIKVFSLSGLYQKTINERQIMGDVRFTSQLDGGQGELITTISDEIDSTIVAYNNIIRVYESDTTNNWVLIYSGVVTNITRVSEGGKDYIEVRAIGLATMLTWLSYYSGSYVFSKNIEASLIIKDIIANFSGKYQSYPTEGLAGYYPFNWNADDESGNGYNGTVNLATLTTDRFGNSNRAYSFNGTTSYISIGNVINPGLWDISFSGWFNTSTAGAFQSIVSKSRAAGANWRYGLMLTGGEVYAFIDFDAPANIWKVSIPEGPYIDGNWHLATVTIKRSGNLTLYVDGVKKGTVDVSAHVATNCTSTDILGIGAYNNATGTALTQGFFNGKIGTVSLYNRELTQEEAEQMYIGGIIYYTPSSIDTTGITANFSFDYTKSLEAIRKVSGVATNTFYVDEKGVVQYHPKTGAIGQLTHYLTAGKDIESIKIEENAEEVINKYFLTWASGTITAEDATSQTAYGVRELKETNTSIGDITTANNFGASYISENKDAKRKIQIVVNTAYNIETIRPGDLVTVRNFDYTISALQIQKIEYNTDRIIIDLDQVTSLAREITRL